MVDQGLGERCATARRHIRFASHGGGVQGSGDSEWEEGAVAEHPNVALLREAIEKFSRGDLQGYRSHFAEDVLWHVGGSHRLSGDYRGRDALFAYFAKVQELTGGSLRVELQEIMADDTHGAVFARVTAQQEGQQLDVVLAQAFTIDGERKLSEYWALADDQVAVDTFWS